MVNEVLNYTPDLEMLRVPLIVRKKLNFLNQSITYFSIFTLSLFYYLRILLFTSEEGHCT